MEKPSADDLQHYQKIRQAKADLLSQLDLRAARYGDLDVPAHIEVERAELRQEIATLDSVIGAPLRLDISEILGERGRFLAYHEQNRQLRQEFREGLARVEERLAMIVRAGMRRDTFLIIIVVVVVVMAMVLVFWIGRVSDGRGFIGTPLTMLFGGD